MHRARLAPFLAVLLLAGCAAPQESREGDAPLQDDVRVRVGDVTAARPDVAVADNATTFEVVDALVRVETSVAATGAWTLNVVDAGGAAVERVARGSGAYEGARWLALAPGTYTLDLAGDGTWNATVRTDLSAESLPASWEGDGDDGVGPVRLGKGVATFSVTSDGPVRAWLVDAAGRTTVTLASARNATSEEVRASVREAGVYVVNVEAAGPWTIRVS